MTSLADVTLLPATPVTICDRAYADLLNLYEHDKIRYGDIKRIAIKYALSKQQVIALKVRLSRKRHGIVTSVSARAGKQNNYLDKKLENFNAHGRLYYQTLVLSPDHLNKFPKKAANNGWQGYVSDSFTIMAFRDGKVQVYPKVPEWRGLCADYLNTIWETKAVDSFMASLQANGSKFELAVAIPGVPSGQHYEDKSGLVSIDTDHTPKESGNVEIKVNIGQFELRFDAIDKSLSQLGSKLGGISSGFIYTQLFAEIAQLRADVSALKDGNGNKADNVNILNASAVNKPSEDAERSQDTPKESHELSSVESSQRTIPNRCPRLKEQLVNGQLEYFCPARKETVWRASSPVYRNFICLTKSAGCLYMEVNSK